MAESLERITQPVKCELEEWKVFFRESLQSEVPLLEGVIDHLFEQKGKHIRPLVILLSAAMAGTINKRVYLSATAIEMLHTATLVHDDIVDDADERRGAKSVNAEWGPKVAVLVGDYLLSQSLVLVSKNAAFDLLELMTVPIRQMSEGELLQIEKSTTLDITKDTYFEIINKKTAALIAACAAVGAKAVSASDDVVNRMHQIGEYMGMAFQIRDDIFDYQGTGAVGKPLGNDIIERKITLPLIYALQQVDKQKQQDILVLVRDASEKQENIERVRSFVIEHGGLEHAVVVANNYRDKAIELLHQFDESPYQQALIALAHYITERNK